MSFTEQDEKDLIKLVSQNPVLYDPNEDGYHNHYVKESTWQSVGKTLHKPGEECKRKWKFIRDGYTRFKKKCNGNYPPRNAKNSRHKLLVFLENCSAVPNMEVEPEIQVENTDETSQENSEPHYEFIDEMNFDFVSTNTLKNSRKIKREIEETETTRAHTPQNQKRAKKTDNDRLERDDTNVRKREDDVDLFCRHIAEVLRNLPPLYKAKAKKNISAVVSEYEIKAAQSSSKVAGDDVSLEPDI